MTQFKVINRTTREEQIFNSEEINRFFHCEYDPQTKKVKYYNRWRDYAVSQIKSKSQEFLYNLFIGICSIVFIVCVTKFILLWS
tara:strand:- start:397 stop:648 length:252 start_codon:yes stop_codon:yes gene_type:complete